MRTIHDPFSGLAVFLAVAESGGFTPASAHLGVSPAAISQAVKALEAKLGVALFVRTTRHVRLTEAGTALLSRVKSAATDIAEAVDAAGSAQDEPSGFLRLTVPRMAVPLFVDAVVPALRREHPKIRIEIAVEDAAVDLLGRGFDAGVRIGEYVELDMIGVRLTRDIMWSVVGSPSYLATHGLPQSPEDLAAHENIRYRFPTSGAIYRWEFERNGRSLSVDPPGSLVVNDGALLVSLAASGLGLSYVADIAVETELRAGLLVGVLQPYLPTTPGLFLYFPRRAQNQPKLRALIDIARKVCRV
ncbi:LysR family transcriptional regulator [Phyllobacterium endophyticum]|uniref:LysR family transcriptional regulator n=1 Tax=Phyllobacterium endophyticum TaxID=1149773 RepID=A0A2P7APC3_9HYPH|nr:LysR family transcriptional regulator [Phyllobacterium endophyticum]MBB3233583.1 DNA-binding transcriptional LysR family regulator [Phyllobacterium endophyticum]PSH56048.1 LysR family transcriptional regulator [Phyllobacterium endophyticum]TYR41198.1 LysR family transcriptional regulator [Phyllobacterium endophyticum]